MTQEIPEGVKTEQITLEEYQRRQKTTGASLPVYKAEAVVRIFDKDGNLKSELNFTSDYEEEDNATS